jgi:hypothetical protein
MKKLNSPFLRNRTRYFPARVVLSIAFLAAMIFVIARIDSPSRAQGCTTDPVVAVNVPLSLNTAPPLPPFPGIISALAPFPARLLVKWTSDNVSDVAVLRMPPPSPPGRPLFPLNVDQQHDQWKQCRLRRCNQ